MSMNGDHGQSRVAGGFSSERLRSRHPGFRDAIIADARVNAVNRGEEFPEARVAKFFALLRLCWVSDAFAAQVAYRAKAAMQRRGVPLLPRLAHRFAMASAQLSIGDPVLVERGVYVVHGSVVIDGFVEVGEGTVIAPWVTIGLKAGNLQGPVIGSGVQIGTGAKILGPVRIGDRAVIGANAVVVADVAAGEKVVGVPSRELVGR